MIIYIFIHPECFYNTIRAYTRLKILVEGAEITHNYLLSRRHTSQKVFDIIASYSFVYFQLYLIDMKHIGSYLMTVSLFHRQRYSYL